MEREKPIAHKLSLAHRNEERRLNKIREAVASVVGEEDAAHLWDWYVIETGDWNAEVRTVTPSQRTDPRLNFESIRARMSRKDRGQTAMSMCSPQGSGWCGGGVPPVHHGTGSGVSFSGHFSSLADAGGSRAPYRAIAANLTRTVFPLTNVRRLHVKE